MAVEVRRTPLYPRHVAAGGRMVDFAGWEMPQQYSSIREENQAVRRAAGLFDVSHMGRFAVIGEGAGEFLQSVVTNDVGRLKPGRAQYNLLCNDDGGILDDLVIYKTGSPPFTVVVNAGNRDKDLDWLQAHAPAAVTVEDRSDETCLLAFQGPMAPELLPVSGVDFDALPYFGLTPASLAGAEIMLARTGYTGEDGFELFVPADAAGRIWDLLLEQGAAHGVRPCGLGARDLCRLEAGLRLWGSDIDEGTSPFEAGLGWTVKLEKGDFVGREALLQLQSAGQSREIVGFTCRDRTIPRHGARVSVDGRPVGKVTSGSYSFLLGRGLGMAYVRIGWTAAGQRLEVEARGQAGDAEVVPLPFYKGSARSHTAIRKPADRRPGGAAK
jgi:aminomethyltransferase